MHFGVTGWSHLICRKNKNIWLAIKQINGWINFYSYCVAHCHHPIYFTRSKNSTERERAPNTWITNGRITLYCYVFFHYSYPLGIDSGTNSNLLTTFIRRVGYTAKTNCEDARWPVSYMVATAERVRWNCNAATSLAYVLYSSTASQTNNKNTIFEQIEVASLRNRRIQTYR